MTKDLERAFLRGLKLAIATPSNVADGVGKAYRTLRAYQEGSRQVTAEAAHALVKYLRRQAGAMLKAADVLERVITKQEERDA